MSLRYSYPGGVSDQERPILEKFERDILPYTMKHGPRIGEDAMAGDRDAEQIIVRQRLLCEGVPEMRAINFRWLVSALKRWEANRGTR